MSCNSKIDTKRNLNRYKIEKNVAVHQAGHAAAIYLNNLEKGWPPVFFQILITPLDTDFYSLQFDSKSINRNHVKVDGGRLTPILPSSFEVATDDFFSAQTRAYERAFEADMINILVGPLSEAKYIGLRDGELMTPNMINVNALQYYGGASHLESLNEYLDCFSQNQELKEHKMTELFSAAFNFVNNNSNWRSIIALSDLIESAGKEVIGYDEIVTVVEAAHSLSNPGLYAGYPIMMNECA